MDIIMLKGSPHESGTSNTLAEEFIKGAREAGHIIEEVDLGRGELIHPCFACNRCEVNGECVQKDIGNDVLSTILNADAICFVTPVYYFGMSSGLKMMIDRFYAKNKEIMDKKLKACLITTASSEEKNDMEAIEKQFKLLFDYFNFDNKGMILGTGCKNVKDMPRRYYREAYEMGKNIFN